MLWCNWVNCLMFIKWRKGLLRDLYVPENMMVLWMEIANKCEWMDEE